MPRLIRLTDDKNQIYHVNPGHVSGIQEGSRFDVIHLTDGSKLAFREELDVVLGMIEGGWRQFLRTSRRKALGYAQRLRMTPRKLEDRHLG